MKNWLFRPSAIGKLMTAPKLKSETGLSVGAKTYVRELASQAIFGVDFEFSSRPMDKGIQCEEEAIALLNRVRGLNLSKNKERRKDAYLTGECDLYEEYRKKGHDIKCSWSLQTFPILECDCLDKIYEWQMRAYMRLWDAASWEVNYVMVSTPPDLIKFESYELHQVEHIPEEMRLTTWTINRDMDKEQEMLEKIELAREYMQTVFDEFETTHKGLK